MTLVEHIGSILGVFLSACALFGWLAGQWMRVNRLEWQQQRLAEDVAPLKGMPAEMAALHVLLTSNAASLNDLKGQLVELTRVVREHHEHEARV